MIGCEHNIDDRIECRGAQPSQIISTDPYDHAKVIRGSTAVIQNNSAECTSSYFRRLYNFCLVLNAREELRPKVFH